MLRPGAAEQIKIGGFPSLAEMIQKTLDMASALGFDADKLNENASTLISAVVRAKPSAAKGKYVKKISLSSTMGPGLKVDLAEVEGA